MGRRCLLLSGRAVVALRVARAGLAERPRAADRSVDSALAIAIYEEEKEGSGSVTGQRTGQGWAAGSARDGLLICL